MKTMPFLRALLYSTWLVPGLWSTAEAGLPTILLPAEASALERFAAREVRRYVYLRTGQLLPIRAGEDASPPWGGAIIVSRKDRPLVITHTVGTGTEAAMSALEPDEFWLKTYPRRGGPTLVLAGGSEVSTLYAAYRLAEHLGVRFYLHGDVLPDRRTRLDLPVLDERSSPHFALRGIQPFHDFPEGPDWWNEAEYRAILAQLPKLRMNFFALHTYPENAPNAEPTVWIGQRDDFAPDGSVTFSYPASYMNTLRGNWGYAARLTSQYVFGASQLFEHDAFGPDVMIGHCPQPDRPEDCNTVFNQTATMLRQAFTFARRLGIQTCVGTETPLTIPRRVQERLRAAGRDPADPAVLEQLYEAMFARAVAAYPLDYYWFWTPEGWTWEGTKPEQIQRTLDDLDAALRAHESVAPPFKLATCGWVLGPVQDRALFDKVLPKHVAVSCINREVGKTPVDRAFREVSGRGKWAIPWLEDDPALTSPQLWVGRMRRDAADARRYGCDGLMGIHWRTRVLAPNVSALAQAAWNQSDWNTDPLGLRESITSDGAVGGAVAAFPNHAIADTEDDPVYQTVRYNLSAYHLEVPNGTYRVTLKFCEPHYAAAGQRVFGVKLQGKRVIERLDLFEQAGQNRALDFSYPEVVVLNGWLDLEFLPIVEFPSIAGIVVEGGGLTRKLNCGGPAYQDFAADKVAGAGGDGFPPVTDFYRDWALHEFGPEIGPHAGSILERVDGKLPRPSDWVDGPGGIRPDPRPWEVVAREYDFVAQLETLRPPANQPGYRSRFEYWLATFRYQRLMGQVNCVWAEFNRALDEVKAAATAADQQRLAREQALPIRRRLVQLVGQLYEQMFATVSTTGELGTVMNWEQHNLPGLLTKPGEELAALLGAPLPPDAQPASAYQGPARLIVPTTPTCMNAGEPFRLKAIVLAGQPPRQILMRWRTLGRGEPRTAPARLIARGVYQFELPPDATRTDLEYYVRVTTADGAELHHPATAPALNHTVVVLGR